MAEILLDQLTDPFRIGLIAFLVVTARNTAATTGTILPLILGVVFVAIVIPVSFDRSTPDLSTCIGVGLIANAILLAAALALFWIARRLMPQSRS